MNVQVSHVSSVVVVVVVGGEGQSSVDDSWFEIVHIWDFFIKIERPLDLE